MTYYIRHVLTDGSTVTLPELEQALQSANVGYEIDEDTVVLDGKDIGQIEIIGPGDDFFPGDLELLRGFAERKRNKAILQAELLRATSLVFVQPLWSLGYDGTLNALEPLFYWLLANRAGILADEGGSFYNAFGPLD